MRHDITENVYKSQLRIRIAAKNIKNMKFGTRRLKNNNARGLSSRTKIQKIQVKKLFTLLMRSHFKKEVG